MDKGCSSRIGLGRICHQRVHETVGASRWHAQNGESIPLLAITGLQQPANNAFQVTAPSGIDFGDLHIPCGVRVAAPNHHIQRDPDFYSEAERYNIFRYAAPCGSGNPEAYLQRKQNSLSMPSDTFLAWGHGRHACPGRFFAAHLMKIMLAHVLVSYDVTAKGPRPEGFSRNEFPVPSVTATFEVKRR